MQFQKDLLQLNKVTRAYKLVRLCLGKLSKMSSKGGINGSTKKAEGE